MKSGCRKMFLVGLSLFWLMALSASAQDPKKAEETKTAQKAEDTAPTLTLTPMVRYLDVDGDERAFRQQWWIREGWAGGIEELTFERKLANDFLLKFEGRGIWDEGDYRLGTSIEKKDLGFVRAGFSNYRKYFDDSGGYYARFTRPPVQWQDLNKDLHLDIGNIFVEAGLRVPNFPEIDLGYERQYKDGKKSSLQWGTVTQNSLPLPTRPSGNVSKKIYPTDKEIDETVDIVKFGVEHDFGSLHVGNQFRWEHYRLGTQRHMSLGRTFTLAGVPVPAATKNATVTDSGGHDAFFNTLHMEQHLTDKLYWSAGYLFSSLEGDAYSRVFTNPYTGSTDKRWRTHYVDLDQDSHVVNLNLSYDFTKHLTAYGGFEAEATETDGRAFADLFEVRLPQEQGLFHTDSDKSRFEGRYGMRFTGIPFTSLYAEGRWTRETIDLFETELLRERPIDPLELGFERLTDTNIGRQIYTFGFSTSPIARTTLTGQYRLKVKQNDYDHKRDLEDSHTPNTGEGSYSAFITQQDFYTNELNTKITYRPTSRISLSFKYQLVDTEIVTSHQRRASLGIPAHTLDSGEYQSNIYSAGITLTPCDRLYLTGVLSFQDTATHAFDNKARSISPYRGNVVSFLGGAGYAIDKKTDLTLNYIYSQSDNFINDGFSRTPPRPTNTDYGLPLLIDYQQHAIQVGLAHRLTDNMQLGLNYALFIYDEGSSGHMNDYTANMVSGNLKLRF